MRKIILLTSAIALVALEGCVAYPAYQQPVARLTPSQSAALANRPIDPAERDRLAQLDAQVQREDRAELAASQAYTYAAPAPYYVYPYSYPDYGYPYYGGYYPWAPGVSLSLGFGFHRGFHRGWGGRGWGGRGWGGGHGWGGHGSRGGGGGRGHR